MGLYSVLLLFFHSGTMRIFSVKKMHFESVIWEYGPFCPGCNVLTLWCLGPVSISDKTSYVKISQRLEGTRSDEEMFVSLWNLTGTSAAVLPRCLSNFRAMRTFHHPISWLRDFARSYNKTSYRILLIFLTYLLHAYCDFIVLTDFMIYE